MCVCCLYCFAGYFANARATAVVVVFQGRFTIAAKHHMTIAEIYETDIVDVEKVRCRVATVS